MGEKTKLYRVLKKKLFNFEKLFQKSKEKIQGLTFYPPTFFVIEQKKYSNIFHVKNGLCCISLCNKLCAWRIKKFKFYFLFLIKDRYIRIE